MSLIHSSLGTFAAICLWVSTSKWLLITQSSLSIYVEFAINYEAIKCCFSIFMLISFAIVNNLWHISNPHINYKVCSPIQTTNSFSGPKFKPYYTLCFKIRLNRSPCHKLYMNLYKSRYTYLKKI